MNKGPKTGIDIDQLLCSECYVPEPSSSVVLSTPSDFKELPRWSENYITAAGSSGINYELDYVDSKGRKFKLTVTAETAGHVKEITERLRQALRHAT